jgi:AcrR family transcriptional regulator
VPKKKLQAKPQPYHHGDLRRALIDTALQLVTEEQDWTFSLREVARRAGVSHRAPYNHFTDKRDLLGAVAAVGFERLYDGLSHAIIGVEDPEAAVLAICRAYMRLGLEDPALYRLMFGPALSDTGTVDRPAIARSAGDRARAVLEDTIQRGALAGIFAVLADDRKDVVLAALSVWSAVHGLTMLMIDKIPRAELAVDDIIERLLGIVVAGLRHVHTEPSRQRRPTRTNGEPGAVSASSPGQMMRKRKEAMQ